MDSEKSAMDADAPTASGSTPPPRSWKRVTLRVGALVLAGAVGYAAATVQPVVFRPPIVLGQDAVSTEASQGARVTLEDAGGPAIVVRPAQGAERLLFVLYPGGLVRPQAYEWLARALASQGVVTVIPAFPADLAVIDSDRAEQLIARYAEGRPVVVGGHSLGGAMAAAYAADHPERVRGLVLLAAYPAGADRVEAPWPAVSVAASNDGRATPDAVRSGLEKLPAETRLVMIEGAVHSFFGRYGPQDGDGIPTIARAEAEPQIVAAVSDYLATIR